MKQLDWKVCGTSARAGCPPMPEWIAEIGYDGIVSVVAHFAEEKGIKV